MDQAPNTEKGKLFVTFFIFLNPNFPKIINYRIVHYIYHIQYRQDCDRGHFHTQIGIMTSLVGPPLKVAVRTLVR
jgi:hypothetical protein